MNKEKFSLFLHKSDWYRNLRLKNQFIIIISCLVLVIVGIVGLSNYIHQNLIKYYFSQASNQIFSINTHKITTQQLNSINNYFQTVFHISKNIYLFVDGQSLIGFHQLYRATKKQVEMQSLRVNRNYQMFYAGIVQIPDPLRIINGYGTNDISNCFMCYSNLSSYDDPLTLTEQIGIKMQEQVQVYGQLLYHGALTNQLFLYSYIIEEKTTSIYPCLNRREAIYQYVPEQRPWYIDIEENYKSFSLYDQYNYSVSNPFILYTDKKIGYTIGLPIVNENLELIGGVGCNFLGDQLLKFLSYVETDFQVIYLITENGTMVIHPYTVPMEELPLYIYNQSYTGFNPIDWGEFFKVNFTSNCQKEMADFQIKCRYNSLYQQDMLISIQHVPQLNMYLIMLSSGNDYLTFFDSLENELSSRLTNQLIFTLSCLGGTLVVICFIIVGFSHCVFFQLKILSIKPQEIFEIIYKKPSLLVEKLMSGEFENLLLACQNFFSLLITSSFTKSDQCIHLENQRYPNKMSKDRKQIYYLIRTLRKSELLKNDTLTGSQRKIRIWNIYSIIKENQPNY